MTVLRWTITFDLHISGNERKKLFVNTYKNNFELCIPYAYQSSCSHRICISFWLGLDLQCKPHHTKLMISSAARQKRQYPWPPRSDAVSNGAIETAWKNTTIEPHTPCSDAPDTGDTTLTLSTCWSWSVNGLASVKFLRAQGLPRVPAGVGILGFSASGALGSFCFLGSWQL